MNANHVFSSTTVTTMQTNTPSVPCELRREPAPTASSCDEHLAGPDFQVTWPPPLVPCPPGQEAHLQTAVRTLRPEVAARVQARAAEWVTTPSAVYLAAWLSVLRIYTGRDDLVLETPSARQDTAAADGAGEGPARPVLLRLRLTGAQPFRAVVAAAAAESVALRAVARLPLRFVAGAASSEVSLSVEDVGASTRLVLEYRRGTLDAALAGRLLAHVDARLDAATAQPDTPLRQLTLARPEERQQIDRWGFPRAEALASDTVTALFAEVARARPDDTAVVCDGERVTYHALARRAAAAAIALRDAGVEPGDRVVLQLGRGVRFIAGALGVLQCGAAYVPIDPSEPAVRRQRMLEPVKPRLGLREMARPGDEAVPAWLDASVADGESDAGPEAMMPPAITADTAAYVMFTSGSRGLPKGVAVPHRAIARLVRGQSFARMGPAERWLHMAPVTFDAATLEIWAPLLNGGRCIVLDHVVPGPAVLDETIRREGVTSAWITSSLFNVLVDEAPQCLAGLRQLLTGGEALSPAHVRRALASLPDVRLVNGYGPTENTTFTCCHDITAADVEPGRSVPIGRPIAHTTVRVLDADGQLAPIGVPGELVSGGAGVALGYVGAPELAEARFEADPDARHNGALRYRTGDRARWRPDGALEFLGRFDDQVKIHGHRIEPGEVTAILAEHPAVRQAAVVPREAPDGRLRLVAYVVAQQDAAEAALPDRLADHVAERLPPYLRPSAFVVIPELPLTANGKLDQTALPAAWTDVAGGELRAGDELEQAVGEIFSDVLSRPVTTRDANFFRLGGDSLQAMCVAVQCHERLGVDVPAAALFDQPTVAAFAQHLRSRRARPAEEHGFSRVPRGGRLALTPAQHALWLDVRLRPPEVYHEAWAWEVAGAIDAARMAAAVARVASVHELLRARLVEEGGEPAWVADRAPGAGVLEWVTDASAASREAELDTAVRRPFDLAAGPLWRCVWRGEREGGGVLLLVMHHLIVDAATVGVLQSDLSAAYAGQALPARAIDFGDVAASEQQRLAADRETLVAFWAQHLAGADPDATWPSPLVPCPAGQETRGEAAMRLLPPEIAERVRGRAAEWATTPFVVYLAAWLSVMRTWTGRDDLVVGTPATLRDAAAADGVVGYLLSPVALRLGLTGTEPFRDVVAAAAAEWASVRAQARLPLHLAHRAAGGAIAKLGSPVQVFFTLVAPVGGEWRLGEAVLRMRPLRPPPVKFEVFVLVEDGGADVRLVLEYQRGTLDAALADRLLADVEERLAAATAQPGTPLSRLPLSQQPALPAGAKTSGLTGRAARVALPPGPVREDPGSPLAHEILEIWRKLLGNTQLGLDDNFFDAGGDSLHAVQMLAHLEHVRGECVSAGMLMQAGTARLLAAALEKSFASQGAYPRGIVLVQRGDSSRNLFCLPGLGGVALQFRPLAPRLRTRRSILAVEVHHLDTPASAFESLEETASAVVAAIRAVQPEGPYAVLGYSYGGNLGVEVVRRLIADGQHVELAAILAATTPDATRRPAGLRKLATHLRIAGRLTIGEAVAYTRLRLMRKLHLTSRDLGERVVMVNDRRHVRRASLAPPPVSEAERRIEAAAESGLRAVQSHRPAPFPGSIVLLHPTRLPDWVEMVDPTGTCGWGAVCESGVETFNLPFGHWDLFAEPGVDVLATIINRLLERLDGPGSAGDMPLP